MDSNADESRHLMNFGSDFKIAESVKSAVPGSAMLLSCLLGVFLIFKANTCQSDNSLSVYAMYFFGSVCLAPSLILFFILYQKLLRPRKSVLIENFEETSTEQV